ncbi:MAG: aldehyde dehydrogenase (NADP(+)) [Verrucomicrobiota bacterium]
MSQPVLIAGEWRQAQSSGTFQAENPATKSPLSDEYPFSTWADCDAALQSASEAFDELLGTAPEKIAEFLEAFAANIEARKDDLVEMANQETGLPASPRLADAELPRTTNQLRQAADAVREGSWAMPTIDTQAGIRSVYRAIGPVCVFGPNNFPFAFNSMAGGDFAAAIAAGNPVIAKANSSHPGTTRLFAEEAHKAAQATGMPAGIVQLIYRTGHADGEKLVSDARVGATGYTGSRSAGLKLKAAADGAGKPIYLELSSVNPVVILPGAIAERAEALAQEFTTSCLMGTGQFCTNPGMVLVLDGESTESMIQDIAKRFGAAPVGTLLSKGVETSLSGNLNVLVENGAEVLVGNAPGDSSRYSVSNTLLRVRGETFLEDPETMQTEAFGNASLIVVATDLDQAAEILKALEGNLTGSIYSETGNVDDGAYAKLEPILRQKVGRLLNDKMPTGVAVSAAMNHGGPFPATGHPGFTAVGIPGSIFRFAMLQSYDAVRPHRLPTSLQDERPNGTMWRRIDGRWDQA